MRFNWPYFAATAVLIAVLLGGTVVNQAVRPWAGFAAVAVLVVLLLALLATHIVYDRSGLYELDWLPSDSASAAGRVATVHAGFDDVSDLLRIHLDHACEVRTFQFELGERVERSILRARELYDADEGTSADPGLAELVETGPYELAVVFMSAHEVREPRDRAVAFEKLSAAVAPSGSIVVVEHLRDWRNALAFNLGSRHFLPRTAWLETFNASGLRVATEGQVGGLVTVFWLVRRTAA